MSRIKKCLCCGNEYSYCSKCVRRVNSGFSNEFDSKTCAEIFNIVSGYNMKVIDKNEAKSMLNKLGVKDFSKYKPSIKKVLIEITSTNTSKKEKNVTSEDKAVDKDAKVSEEK